MPRLPRTFQKIDAALPWIMSIATFLGSLPLLAHFAQTGDGAELVLTATNGGSLHPPGFPLQAWFQRLFVLLPFETPAWRISLISALAHSATSGVVCLIGRSLGWALPVQAIIALLYSTTTAFWYLGLQPEVFSVTFLISSLTLLYSIQIVKNEKTQASRDFIILGSLVGLGLSQHLVTVLNFPSILPALYLLWRKRKAKETRSHFIRLILPAVLIPLVFYSSLPLLVGTAIWPNWGELNSPKDVFLHAIRKEYGVFSLTSHPGVRTFSALGLLLADFQHDWGLLSILLPFGIAASLRQHGKKITLVLILSLLAGFAFLLQTSVVFLNTYAESILGRFLGVIMLPCILFIGVVTHFIASKATKHTYRNLWLGAVFVLVAFRVPNQVHSLDLSGNRMIDIFREAVFLSIPDKTVAFAGTDVEVFAGTRNPKTGKPRYLVAPGLLNLDWYRQRVVPEFLPGVRPPKSWGDRSLAQLVSLLWEQGLSVASISPEFFGAEVPMSERSGLLFVRHGPYPAPFNAASSQSIILLCSAVIQIPPLPKYGRSIDHALVEFFIDAFLDAAKFHRGRNEPALSESFWKVASGLSKGTDPEDWIEPCRSLASAKTKKPE